MAKDPRVDANIEQFKIPTRSLDLSVMDCCIWADVKTKLRENERRWFAERRKTRHQVIICLRRVIRNYTTDEAKKAIGRLARRSELPYRAEL